MRTESYFPLETDLIYNERVMSLIERYGITGFGIYILMLAELRRYENYRIGPTSLRGFARKHRINMEKLEHILHDFELFEFHDEDGDIYISSPYMDRVMQPLENYRKKHAAPIPKKKKVIRRGANGRFTAKAKPTVTVEPPVHGSSTVTQPAVKKNKVDKIRIDKTTTTTTITEKGSCRSRNSVESTPGMESAECPKHTLPP